MKCKRNIILFFLLIVTLLINAQTLTIEITNIRDNNGIIVLAVFKDKDSFRKEEAFLIESYHKRCLNTGEMTVKIQIEQGIYGITILDDENYDNEMEYNLIGFPKEGYGFSNFYHRGISKPNFEDFDFVVGEEDIIVQVKMKYKKKQLCNGI